MIQNRQLVNSVLAKKCQFKNISVPTYESIENHEKLNELEPQWEHMLAHQLPSLPPMSAFWDDLQPFFDWLNGTLEVQQLVQSDVISGTTFQVDSHHYAQTDSLVHKIQFAAANRVCVKLRYSGKDRIIEPLSFRIASTGKKLFYGFERETGHVKAYEINKIEFVEVTNLQYVEKYPVEINSTGITSMPPLRVIRSKIIRKSRRYSSSSKYKIQCSVCQKIFYREKLTSTKLNKHKNKYGTICHGRIGYKIG